MLKKTIKYTDYSGNEREEDFYFNLNKTELMEMAISKDGGLDVVLQRLMQKLEVREIFAIIKELILKAYGEKSDDGKIFEKSPELSHRFECTEAFNVLFMELVEDSDKALAFINALFPEDVRKKIEELRKQQDAENQN